MDRRRLLIVAHAPSANTRRLLDAVVEGACSGAGETVDVVAQRPFDTEPEHVLAARAVILGTTENLGYMSGALKDFFDRCYYPCLDRTDGLAYALYIRAGHDGTGTRRGVEAIATGLRWRAVQAPLVCRGSWNEDFAAACRDLGAAVAAGLDAGIY
ncbi:MAG: flavodoxin family protein [Alphaproteobacteria bacterium]|nr:flavodoxin family protein [Alphaproteobacteria bacterium]